MTDLFKKTYTYILMISFFPMLWNGIHYSFIGLFYPMLIALLLLSLIIYFVFGNRREKLVAAKSWSILLIGYSIIRFGMLALTFIDDGGIPSAIYYQPNSWFFVKNCLFFVVGVWLYHNRMALNNKDNTYNNRQVRY